jgi:hypothetical protein
MPIENNDAYDYEAMNKTNNDRYDYEAMNKTKTQDGTVFFIVIFSLPQI